MERDTGTNPQGNSKVGEEVLFSSEASASPVEAALICLALAARVTGLPVDSEGLCRAFPSRDPDALTVTLLRAAKKIGLKAKKITTSIDRLERLPQPSLLLLAGGEVLIFLRAEAAANKDSDSASAESASDGRVMLLHPREQRPFVWKYQQLAESWDGSAIPLVKRFSLAELSRKFSIGWFLPVILRFKKHLGEVFIGSFFLQSFGLISPPLFSGYH